MQVSGYAVFDAALMALNPALGQGCLKNCIFNRFLALLPIDSVTIGLCNDMDDVDFSLTDTAPTTLDATQSFDDIHMVRVGLTYNFAW
jgi:hypothetical protein